MTQENTGQNLKSPNSPRAREAIASRELEFLPRTDVIEGRDVVRILMEVPGVEEGQVDITLDQGELNVVAKATPMTFEGFSRDVREYQQGTFRRKFNLSDQLKSDAIQAQLKDGVLTLTIPKSEKMMPRKIAIKSA